MNILKTFAALLILALSSTAVMAQYDDIYYDPSNDSYETEYYDEYETVTDDDLTDGSSYDDEYLEDYDYYYTSRIRRFSRPVYGFGYYSPYYTDYGFYDSFP